MNALVTGGNGFIGSHLVEALLERGDDVRCLVRATSDLRWLEGLAVELTNGDCLDRDSLRAAVAGTDVVFHLAGVVRARKPETYYAVNQVGTRNLLDACEQHGSGLERFVYVSSQAAAGPSCDGTPVTEADPPAPITHYGRSKLLGEEAVLAAQARLPVAVVRPPAVYGPRERDVYTYFKTVRRGFRPLLGWGDRRVSLCYVKDLVSGILLAGSKPQAIGQTYFVADEAEYTWEEIGLTIQRELGVKALRVRMPVFFLFSVSLFAEFFAKMFGHAALLNREKAREMAQRYWLCDAAKAREELGYCQEFGLQRGVAATAKWYQERGWL